MREQAFGIGLTPAQFWRCTPAEIYMLLRARGKSLEAYHQIAAWHASHMIRALTGDWISPDELLGKSKKVRLSELAETGENWREVLEREAEDDSG